MPAVYWPLICVFKWDKIRARLQHRTQSLGVFSFSGYYAQYQKVQNEPQEPTSCVEKLILHQLNEEIYKEMCHLYLRKDLPALPSANNGCQSLESCCKDGWFFWG